MKKILLLISFLLLLTSIFTSCAKKEKENISNSTIDYKINEKEKKELSNLSQVDKTKRLLKFSNLFSNYEITYNDYKNNIENLFVSNYNLDNKVNFLGKKGSELSNVPIEDYKKARDKKINTIKNQYSLKEKDFPKIFFRISDVYYEKESNLSYVFVKAVKPDFRDKENMDLAAVTNMKLNFIKKDGIWKILSIDLDFNGVRKKMKYRDFNGENIKYKYIIEERTIPIGNFAGGIAQLF